MAEDLRPSRPWLCCGAGMSGEAKFCDNCGKPIVAEPAYIVPLPAAARHRKWLIPTVLIVVVVAGSIIGVLGVTYIVARGAIDSVDYPFCASGFLNTTVSGGQVISGNLRFIYGVRNAGLADVNAKWTVAIDYGGGVAFQDTTAFTVTSHGSAYPTFNWILTPAQVRQINLTTTITSTLTRNYSVYIYTFNLETSYMATSSRPSQGRLPDC